MAVALSRLFANAPRPEPRTRPMEGRREVFVPMKRAASSAFLRTLTTGAPRSRGCPRSQQHTSDTRGHEVRECAGHQGAQAQSGEVAPPFRGQRADAADLDTDGAQVG